jgi:hypothetical protein
VSLTTADLAPFADIPEDKANVMIADALALAARVAPCITETAFEFEDAARAILRGAILRWHEAGSGALSQQTITTGPFSQGQTFDTRQQRRSMFWPSEIAALQELCSDSSVGGAYGIDTLPVRTSNHADICALNFGALYCSCGAVLTAGLYPLYEV